MTTILGISALYHDSAAALLRDGALVAAAQEERFTRRKHDARFPRHAVRYCLDEAGIALESLDAVVFYDKPLLKFERLLETQLAEAPRGFATFRTAMPVWLKEKLYFKRLLRDELGRVGGCGPDALPPLLFSEHHRAHAASAFFPSPHPRAAVLCVDGVGEWATTSAWRGDGARLEPLWEIRFPHSLGLLYSAFTAYCGFEVNDGEYKLMGLAPYGEPRYVGQILDELIDLKADGSFRLAPELFAYTREARMVSAVFERRFGGPPRGRDEPLDDRHRDLARSIQVVTEEVMLRLARSLHAETGEPALCLAGGVALNCVANGRLLREGPFDAVWVQPAAGDAGGALGAAFDGWHRHFDAPRAAAGERMQQALLGPGWDDTAIGEQLGRLGARVETLDEERLAARVADALRDGAVVGWFQGRMEFGPRALGDRSILADPRPPEMGRRLNLAVKRRESFRPFAPVVLAEEAAAWFDSDRPSPYMLFTARLRAERHVSGDDGVPRPLVPAVTHVDGSARLQTVAADGPPRLRRLLERFHAASGCPILVNTSFNLRGEPIVATPEDAYRCFLATDIDLLVAGNHLVSKPQTPPPPRPDPAAADDTPVDPALLRRWGLALALALGLLLGVVLPLLADVALPLWPWPLALAIALIAGFVPRALAPLWRLQRWLGPRVTTAMLGLIYFGLITPMGVVMRWFGYDPLERRARPGSSYRHPVDEVRGPESMRQPF